MISAPLNDALATLTTALLSQPALDPLLRRHWRDDPTDDEDELPKELQAAADVLSAELPALSTGENPDVALLALLANHGGLVLLTWCSSSAWRAATAMTGAGVAKTRGSSSTIFSRSALARRRSSS